MSLLGIVGLLSCLALAAICALGFWDTGDARLASAALVCMLAAGGL